MRRFWNWIKKKTQKKEVKPKRPIDKIPVPRKESNKKWDEYSLMYKEMEMVESPSYYKKSFKWAMASIMENMQYYMDAEKLTGVPWQVIGAIHFREASCDMNKQLLNGQDWRKKTTWVPRNRGPWDSWEEACIEAFEIDPMPIGSKNIGQWLDALERYNGLGYRYKKIHSPYIWGGTQFYKKGHYYSDGKFSYSRIAKRAGMAILLQEMGFLIESDSNS